MLAVGIADAAKDFEGRFFSKRRLDCGSTPAKYQRIGRLTHTGAHTRARTRARTATSTAIGAIALNKALIGGAPRYTTIKTVLISTAKPYQFTERRICNLPSESGYSINIATPSRILRVDLACFGAPHGHTSRH